MKRPCVEACELHPARGIPAEKSRHAMEASPLDGTANPDWVFEPLKSRSNYVWERTSPPAATALRALDVRSCCMLFD